MNEIKLDSALFMALDESDKANITSDVLRDSYVTFLEYFEFLLQGGFDQLNQRLLTLFDRKRWAKYKDDELVATIILGSVKERDEKAKKKEYYYANGYCAITILKKLFTKKLFDVFSNLNSSNYYSTYYQILKTLMGDIFQLENMFKNNINQDKTFLFYGHSSISAVNLHNSLRQSLYGNFSFHSFADYDCSASVGIIRQIIELRLRKAIGVLGYTDADEKEVFPLQMNRVFDVLDKHKEISFPYNLCYIKKIYQWSNLYIHSGQKDWTWIPFYLESFLRPLNFGIQKSDGSLDILNGISISQKTLNEIYESLMEDVSEHHPDWKLYICKPECNLIIE